MRDFNEPYYGIDCPPEEPYEPCSVCGQGLINGTYVDDRGYSVGCTECVDENENTGSLQCDCDEFSEYTSTVYTRHYFTLDGELEVLGCSECLRLEEEC